MGSGRLWMLPEDRLRSHAERREPTRSTKALGEGGNRQADKKLNS